MSTTRSCESVHADTGVGFLSPGGAQVPCVPLGRSVPEATRPAPRALRELSPPQVARLHAPNVPPVCLSPCHICDAMIDLHAHITLFRNRSPNHVFCYLQPSRCRHFSKFDGRHRVHRLLVRHGDRVPGWFHSVQLCASFYHAFAFLFKYLLFICLD